MEGGGIMKIVKGFKYDGFRNGYHWFQSFDGNTLEGCKECKHVVSGKTVYYARPDGTYTATYSTLRREARLSK